MSLMKMIAAYDFDQQERIAYLEAEVKRLRKERNEVSDLMMSGEQMREQLMFKAIKAGAFNELVFKAIKAGTFNEKSPYEVVIDKADNSINISREGVSLLSWQPTEFETGKTVCYGFTTEVVFDIVKCIKMALTDPAAMDKKLMEEV